MSELKQVYKGHEIWVSREKCLAGYDLLYYSIFRVSDGYECTFGYEDSDETLRDQMRYMKERVDAELAEDDPWMESEDL